MQRKIGGIEMKRKQLDSLYGINVDMGIYLCFKNNRFSFECKADDLEEDYNEEFVYCKRSSVKGLKSKGFVKIESYDNGECFLGKKRFDSKESDEYYVNITDLSEQEIESLWKVYESCESEISVEMYFSEELADAICELKGKKRVHSIKRYQSNLVCDSMNILFGYKDGLYTKREWTEELQELGFCHVSIERILDELEYCIHFAAEAENGGKYTLEDIEIFLTNYSNGKADRNFLPNDKRVDDFLSDFMNDMKEIDDEDGLSDGERESSKENQTYCATVEMLFVLQNLASDQ